MKILSIANHKGGTGKTATARALGDYMAMRGYKTLLLDMDPQASLTMSAGFRDLRPSLVDVIGGAQPGDLPIAKIVRSVRDNLDLAPSNLDMASVELGIASRLGREYILSKALKGLRYDIAIIDCPPSVSLLVINALVACDAVLIPTQLNPVDAAGVRQFISTVDAIRDNLSAKLTILGILATFYDARLTTHRTVLEAMQAAGWAVLPVTIGRSIRVAEAAASGESVLTYDINNPQSGAYIELGEIIEKWLKT